MFFGLVPPLIYALWGFPHAKRRSVFLQKWMFYGTLKLCHVYYRNRRCYKLWFQEMQVNDDEEELQEAFNLDSSFLFFFKIRLNFFWQTLLWFEENYVWKNSENAISNWKKNWGEENNSHPIMERVCVSVYNIWKKGSSTQNILGMEVGLYLMMQYRVNSSRLCLLVCLHGCLLSATLSISYYGTLAWIGVCVEE